MTEPNKNPPVTPWKGWQYLKIVLGILILLSDCSRLANLASGQSSPPPKSPAEALGHLIGMVMFGVVLPIWLITSAVKRLRSAA